MSLSVADPRKETLFAENISFTKLNIETVVPLFRLVVRRCLSVSAPYVAIYAHVFVYVMYTYKRR